MKSIHITLVLLAGLASPLAHAGRSEPGITLYEKVAAEGALEGEGEGCAIPANPDYLKILGSWGNTPSGSSTTNWLFEEQGCAHQFTKTTTSPEGDQYFVYGTFTIDKESGALQLLVTGEAQSDLGGNFQYRPVEPPEQRTALYSFQGDCLNIDGTQYVLATSPCACIWEGPGTPPPNPAGIYAQIDGVWRIDSTSYWNFSYGQCGEHYFSFWSESSQVTYKKSGTFTVDEIAGTLALSITQECPNFFSSWCFDFDPPVPHVIPYAFLGDCLYIDGQPTARDVSGLNSCVLEGQAPTEGDGEGLSPSHLADQNGDKRIGLSELLRVIQFYNSATFGCEPGTEDGFAQDDADQDCAPHSSDYDPQDWRISLSELLRLIQFYNVGGYRPCPGQGDGFCPGLQ